MDIMLERILSLLPKNERGGYKRGSKKELATSLGFDSGDIVSMWISGSSKSYRNYVYQIAKMYDVSVKWLMGETDEKRPAPVNEDEPPEITMIARAGKKMTPEQRDLMLQWAKLSFPEAFKDD